MKAYKVSCRDDDHGQTIVFAERGKDVDRNSNSDTCDCEFLNRKVHRAPSFDKYAPGPVTIENYLSEGWFWRCCGCEKLVYEDSNPIIKSDIVFCSKECAERYFKKIEGFRHESFSESRKAALEIIGANQ